MAALTWTRRIDQYRRALLAQKADMLDDAETQLTPVELRDFRRLAGFMVPPSAAYRVPGADDAVIFTDIVRSLDRDRVDVRKALGLLREMAGGAFADLDERQAEATAMALLARKGAAITALGRSVLQCYYRDDRVITMLGLEPRAPFPKGHALEPGDWSLLDAVRGRPRMWRDVDAVIDGVSDDGIDGRGAGER